MLARTIQRQVTIGEDVRFLRKDGQEIAGRLIELSQDHITLDCSGKHITIVLDVIGGWEVMQEASQLENETSSRRATQVLQDEDANVNSEQDNDSDAGVESGEHPSDSNHEDALKTALEIEARFQAKIAATDFAPMQPEFDLSTEGHKAKQVLPELDRIKSKYEYALKVNELGAQFGRIQPLISELEKLTKKYPNLSVMFRLLGYFRWLVNDVRKSAEMYKTAAQVSDSPNDWFGFAALADNDALSLYGLNMAYAKSSVSEYEEVWYFYVNLVHKHKAFSALVDLSSNKKNLESDQARKHLLEACLFLLMRAGKGAEATSLASRTLRGEDCKLLLEEANRAIGNLSDEFSTNYSAAIDSFGSMKPPEQRQIPVPQLPASVQQGRIYAYKTDRIFGFISGVDGNTYFFHRSAVSDEELREQLREFKFPIEVAFETAEGPKGPIALNISLPRVTEQIYERAVEYAENGDYAHAIHEIKKVLSQNPDFPSAAELHEKWREYARISIVPRGTNPYARAKRVQLIEKDLDKASELFQIAIRENDHFESAVKDLAVLHTQRGNPEESVKILQQYRKRMSDRRSVDNMLTNFHLKAGHYDETIRLLQGKLHLATSNLQRARTQMQIASCYLQKEDYSKAENHYKKVIRLRPSMLSAHRNIALCAFKLGDYVEAERILSDILDTSTDFKAEELLEAIRQERAGQQSNIDEIIIEVTLPSLSNETSKFTEFFLERCVFYGVRPTRVQEV